MKTQKKTALLAATLALLLLASPALAEQDGGGNGEYRRDGGSMNGGAQIDPAQREKKFQEIKAEILRRMKERQACVEAASNGEELRACMPKRGDRKGGGLKRQGGEGGEGRGFQNGEGREFDGGEGSRRRGGDAYDDAAPLE